MGFSKKTQAETCLESEAKKFVIAGIAVRSLKSINTKPSTKENDAVLDEGECSTPKAKEARIPEILTCPPAPRKQRPSRCNNNNNNNDNLRDFFKTPDLETVFKRHVEKKAVQPCKAV